MDASAASRRASSMAESGNGVSASTGSGSGKTSSAAASNSLSGATAAAAVSAGGRSSATSGAPGLPRPRPRPRPRPPRRGGRARGRFPGAGDSCGVDDSSSGVIARKLPVPPAKAKENSPTIAREPSTDSLFHATPRSFSQTIQPSILSNNASPRAGLTSPKINAMNQQDRAELERLRRVQETLQTRVSGLQTDIERLAAHL